MVLERLFPEDWLEKKFRFAFILGSTYSIIGILIAKFLFPANIGIASVIFTSVLLSPSMRKIFSIEEKSEERVKTFSLKKLYSLDYDVVFMYFLIFFGIFFAYLVLSFLIPQFGFSTFNLLREQMFLDSALTGRATFSVSTFENIFYYNWWILIATFVLALIAGDGAIFFVAWNASVWGAIFGARAFQVAAYSGASPWIFLGSIMAVVIWHIVLEGGGYILAGIAGSTISQKIIKKKIKIKEFIVWIVLSCGMFLLVNFALGIFNIGKLSRFLLYLTTTFILLYFLGSVVAERKNKEVFTYNLAVFLIAIVAFAAGAAVETFVLKNSDTLKTASVLEYCNLDSVPLENCMQNLRLAKRGVG